MADYYANSSATGSGTGTQSSPWTLSQAFANTYNNGDRLGLVGSFTASGNYSLKIGTNGSVYIGGCTSSIGDGGYASVATTSAVTLLFNVSTWNSYWDHLNIDATAAANTTIGSGVYATFNQCNMKANFTGANGALSDIARANRCTIVNSASGGYGIERVGSVTECYIDGFNIGIYTSGSSIFNNVVANCNYGIQNPVVGASTNAFSIENNAIYNCKTGISYLTSNNYALFIPTTRNNIISGSATVAILDTPENNILFQIIFNNAFYNNTANYSHSTGQLGDVLLSADPFVNPTGTIASWQDAFTNFALNDVAGGGALCRGAGTPANLDIGAVQSAAGGGGGGIILPGRGLNRWVA